MSTLTHTAAAAHAPEPAFTYRRTTPTLLQCIGRALWRALEAAGQRRAARDLFELARRTEPFDPERARQLRAAARFDSAS